MDQNPSSKLRDVLEADGVFPHEPVLLDHRYYFARTHPPCLNTQLETLQYIKFEVVKGNERYATVQIFKSHEEANRHWVTQNMYDQNIFIHPLRIPLTVGDKHLLIFPVIMRDFNGCWVHIHANGANKSRVTDDEMWKIFTRIGKNMKYLSSEADSHRPHGNLLNGTCITSDLRAWFFNLGNDTDPQRYHDDVIALHKLLKNVSTNLKDSAIIICVEKWMKFLSDTCLQVTLEFNPLPGSAIHPLYLNHDHVRLVFNYPSSWSSREELQFLANMYQLCTEKSHRRRYNLLKNPDFRFHLIKCNYSHWNNCFVSGRNTSPLNEVYKYGSSSMYFDRTGKVLIISSIILFVGNCLKHYRGSLKASAILDEIRKEFRHLVEDIYQAFYRAVAKGYKHPSYSVEQLLTQHHPALIFPFS